MVGIRNGVPEGAGLDEDAGRLAEDGHGHGASHVRAILPGSERRFDPNRRLRPGSADPGDVGGSIDQQLISAASHLRVGGKPPGRFLMPSGVVQLPQPERNVALQAMDEIFA